ncbi:prephenate dehydrogenase [Planctomycetota bacterium]
MPCKKLQKISIIGMGLLGGSVALGIARCLPGVEVVGYAHRPTTRRKVRALGLVEQVTSDLQACVADANMVILATPLSAFANILETIADHLMPGCIVTDVGSTKKQVHCWAAQYLPKSVTYIGSHPMAGSEQQGIDYARDDLFDGATCIVTFRQRKATQSTTCILTFWRDLGCQVVTMSPAQHDRIVAGVSHVPHAMAVALVNATRPEWLSCAGKGFLDTSRVASGPANVWADIFLTNTDSVTAGIDRLIKELTKLRHAVAGQQRGRIERLLTNARQQRASMINEKLKRKELLK